jgi:hypothetical protein
MTKTMKPTSILLLIASILFLSAAASAQAPSSLKVAVVALSVNEYGGYLKSSGNPQTDQLIQQNLNGLLESTEILISREWQLIPLASFINNPAYQAATIGHLKSGLFAPVVEGTTIPSFTEDRKGIIRSVMTAQQVKDVCAAIGADVVMVVYSEWAVATGQWAPTNKALAKNCVSMYSKDGKQLFFGRKDVMGQRTLGAMGKFAMNEDTIREWGNAYVSGIEQVLHANKSKVR